ncbi:methylglyoxal synthase [Pseudoxanthobacter sp.]|uniref:methylglyoxal synthase n=1 Tax=Pseudoxanthobacter sp. TaxID=1925742 RepID=UPI002FE0E0E7
MAMTIAAVAHDQKKAALADWVHRHQEQLRPHHLIATATTGSVIRKMVPGLDIRTVKSGPLGGDQQIGAMIADGLIDLLVFFPDPLTPMPHDVDVKALLRLALVYDVPCAFNPHSADLIVASRMLAPRPA